MPYDEAMERFGTDKPDLRFGLELKDSDAPVSPAPRFRVFAKRLRTAKRSTESALPGEFQLARRELDEIAEAIRSRHAMGLAWAKNRRRADGRGRSRSISATTRSGAPSRRPALRNGDTLLMVAGPRAQGASDARRTAAAVGGQVRPDRPRPGESASFYGWLISRCSSTAKRKSACSRSTIRLPRRIPRIWSCWTAEPLEGARAGLRHGAERPGAGRRFDPYP